MNIDIAATKIQSCWKGYKTRVLFRQVQIDFEDVCEEIDNYSGNLRHTKRKSFSTLNEYIRIPEFIFKESSFIEKASEKIRENPVLENSKDQKYIVSPSKEKVSKEKLSIEEDHITLELFWVQQAIESRKSYFHIKNNLNGV